MSLNWIATRTHETGVFHPDGLGSLRTADPVGMALLPRGSILIETKTRPLSHPVNLIRYSTLDPWPTGITICLEPDGTVRLLMRQGARYHETSLRTDLGGKVETAHVAYIWDAPSRRGRLSVFVPDHGLLWQTDVIAPFPISMQDAQRIAKDTHHAPIDKEVVFLAIADAPCPLGPVPGLDGSATIDTPDGPRTLRNVNVGDFVSAQHRPPVQVLWTGQATLPALGRFAPMTLRRPYMKLWDDLIASKDQRVCLSGSEVEYHFGEERVTTAVRHLEIRNCAMPTKNPPPVVTYHQILLETHEIITVNGAAVESFDGSAVLEYRDALATSVLADLNPEYRPRQIGLAAPVLQGYEALTLTGVSIG